MDHGASTAWQGISCPRKEEHRSAFSIGRMCRGMDVSPRGLRTFRSRPASRRQRSDMVTLAHIKVQSPLSLGSYGRPRMTEELKELGLNIGHRRVGRLMRQNGISVVRTRKHKVTTDSNHKFNIAPNLSDRNFSADQPNQKWAGVITYIWTSEGWLYLAVILDLHQRLLQSTTTPLSIGLEKPRRFRTKGGLNEHRERH